MPSEKKARLSILVVGSLNMDLVLQVPRMPLPGENVVSSRCTRIPGGKGANQAVALARLGVSVALVGKVGTDADGASLIECVKAEGVSIGFVAMSRENSTGFAAIILDPSGQNSIVVVPGANNDITEEELEQAFAANSFDAVMLQLEMPDRIVLAAYRLARIAGIPVFLDAGPAKPFPLEQLQGIDVLSPNQTEASVLTGIAVESLSDAQLAARKLMERSQAKAIVIKMGASGSFLLLDDGTAEHFAAPIIHAVDPTAAGDAFTAALMVRYLTTGDLRESLVYANCAGALAAMKLGAQPSLPTSQDIEYFRKQRTSKEEAHV